MCEFVFIEFVSLHTFTVIYLRIERIFCSFIGV